MSDDKADDHLESSVIISRPLSDAPMETVEIGEDVEMSSGDNYVILTAPATPITLKLKRLSGIAQF